MIIRKLYLKSKWKLQDGLNNFGFPMRFKPIPGSVRVLCFHGICDDDTAFINGRFMHESQFRVLIEALQKRCNIIHLDDFLAKRFEPTKLNILLTFDDGYQNNQDLVLPIIEKLNVPITLFVTSREERPLWADLVDILQAKKVKLTEIEAVFPEIARLSNHAIKQWIPTLSLDQIEQLTNLLYSISEPHLADKKVFWELISRANLESLAKHPLVSIGNHSANHLDFTELTPHEMKAELDSCENYLESIGSKHPSIVAYPYGRHTTETANLLIEWGYHTQFITEKHTDSPPAMIERLVVNPFISLRNQLKSIEHGGY